MAQFIAAAPSKATKKLSPRHPQNSFVTLQALESQSSQQVIARKLISLSPVVSCEFVDRLRWVLKKAIDESH
jgi:hypothetical protein